MIEFLTASLIRPVVLAAAAWLLLRIGKVRHPASRHAVWTAVLIGMMLLPLVSVFAPQWKLPLLPKKAELVAQTEQPGIITEAEPYDVSPRTTPSQTNKFAWPATQTLIVWCYFAGVFAMAIFRLTGWALLWRVMSKSSRLKARLRESSEVITPVTVGVLRPSVILPAGWRDWNTNTKRAVLAHEFAHIRRRDTLTSSLSRFAKCMYWFHPLAWWISRQISELAELSCDAAALQKTSDPGSYSRILLGFAETVSAAGYRAALPGLAIASRDGMSHRIDQVFELASGNLRRLSRPGTVLALMGVPVMCIAAVVGLTAPAARALHQSSQPVELAQSQQPTASPARPTQQASAASKPRFDAVSIKRCMPGDELTARPEAGGRGGGAGRGPRFSPGRLRMQCLNVADMVLFAYINFGNAPLLNYTARSSDLKWLRNAPAWVYSDWYTIEAETDDPVANGPTGPGSSDALNAMGQMLQAVLEDRFQLKTHRVTEEVPMYALTVAKSGLRIKPIEEGGCTPFDPANGVTLPAPGEKPLCGSNRGGVNGPNRTWDSGGLTMSDFARTALDMILDRRTIDKTGVAGRFNFHLEFAPDETTPMLQGAPVDRSSEIPPGLTIFTALEQQFGLKLESTRGPQEHIVVDHVERPSEN